MNSKKPWKGLTPSAFPDIGFFLLIIALYIVAQVVVPFFPTKASPLLLMKPFFLIMAGFVVNALWMIRLSRKNPAFWEISRKDPARKWGNRFQLGVLVASLLWTLTIYLAFPRFWKIHDSDIFNLNMTLLCLFTFYDNYQAERILKKHAQLGIKPEV